MSITVSTMSREVRARYEADRPTNTIVLVVVGLMVVLAWWHRWTFDDGFINFRVVKQIEAGHGPVFNTGQRVEAFTSPLWVAVLAVADILTPIRLEWLSVLLGICGTATGLTFAMLASRRLWGRTADSAQLLPAGALVIVAIQPFWYFATSGLEGGLTFAWLGGLLYLLARWATSERRVPTGALVVFGAGWLIRPELVLFTIAAAAAVLAGEWRSEGSRRAKLRVSWVLVLPVGYQIFRMGYFASILPNTAFAKAAGGARWGNGWAYLREFATHYLVWLPLLGLLGAAFVPLVRLAGRRERIVVVAWLSAAALATVYVVRVGGDYIPARLLLPGLFAACAPVAFMRVGRTFNAAAFVVVVAWASFVGLSVKPPAPYRTGLGETRANVVTVSQALQGYLGVAYEHANSYPLSFELAPLHVVPGPEVTRQTAALSGIGVLGYAFGPNVDVFDLGGLADPMTSHFELVHRGLPGHEKFIPPPWIAARLTAPVSNVAASALTLRSFILPMIAPTAGAAFDAQVADARIALTCGDLRRLYNSYRGSLGIGGFLTNLVRSVGYSRISIPPDPAAARAKFCR